jgi:Tat protein secretion system quality control protein TatD with DNase activity
VKEVAQFIADLREESFEKIAQQTTANYFQLFNAS